jgi:hypothetical protein
VRSGGVGTVEGMFTLPTQLVTWGIVVDIGIIAGLFAWSLRPSDEFSELRAIIRQDRWSHIPHSALDILVVATAIGVANGLVMTALGVHQHL